MADVVSEGRRLLAEATPRPWEESIAAELRLRNMRTPGGWHLAFNAEPKDASLIVFAVNHLAALLDVADAVKRLEELGASSFIGWEPSPSTVKAIDEAFDAARAALARLEGDTE